MDHRDLGRQLRAMRTATGRTVASVAADAGLSVPYVANLENGRGNPTITALSSLAAALGAHLTIAFNTSEDASAAPHHAPPLPPSLVRLSRTRRFRRDTQLLADALGRPAQAFATRLVNALAQIAQTLGPDLSEADWWRLLDALLLIAVHPDRTKPD